MLKIAKRMLFCLKVEFYKDLHYCIGVFLKKKILSLFRDKTRIF